MPLPQKDDVGTGDLLDDIHDVGMGGYIQPARGRFQTFESTSRNMRTYHMVIRESRIVFYQFHGQRLELRDILLRQPVRRNYETVALISLICSGPRIDWARRTASPLLYVMHCHAGGARRGFLRPSSCR